VSLKVTVDGNARLRATAHPLRLQILSLLTGAKLSAAELARELDTTQANASYHLRVLARCGLVVEAGEEKIRGGVAKRYRHPWDADAKTADRTGFAEPLGRTYVEAAVQELVRRQAYAAPGPSVSTDAELWVTPETWRTVTRLIGEASKLMHAEAKPPRTETTIRANLTVLAFPMKPPQKLGSTRPGGPIDAVS